MKHFQLIHISDGSADAGCVLFEGTEDDSGQIRGMQVGSNANGYENYDSMADLQAQIPNTEVYGGGEV